jgi:hypothetical protein
MTSNSSDVMKTKSVVRPMHIQRTVLDRERAELGATSVEFDMVGFSEV